MLQSEPDDLFLNYALGKACVADGDVEAGLQQFDRVIELDPQYVAAYFQKGQALAEQGQRENARDVIKRGIKVARTVGDSHAEGEMTEFFTEL